MNHKNNAHLKVGEKVICVADMSFSDGSVHKRGETYTVEPETSAYFSLFTQRKDAVQDLSLKYLKL